MVDAAKDVDKVFGKLNDTNISRQIRRQQLALAHKEIRKSINGLFGEAGNLIRNNRQDAAVAAVNAHLFDERGVLARLFKNPVDRQNYADSLRQTARRNVESTVTRVLETELPLSQKVYKTRALANGYVSHAINRGLSRGDSADDIAASVRHLIRPDTPGGVSYAAKRLGRTEINNAFHAQSIHDSQESPWVDEMRWRLSKVHVTDPGDECEQYALQEFFPKNGVPVKPHPNCRCYVVPVLLDYDRFETNLLQGHYDSYIDEVMGSGTADRVIDYGGITPRGVRKFGPNLRAKPPVSLTDTSVTPVDGSWRAATKVAGLDYKFQLAHPEIDVVNFTPENISLEDAKQILGSVDDMLAKYPQAQGNLKQIVLGIGPDDEYARTIRNANGSSTIKFNLSWTKDHDGFYEHVAKNVQEGFHPPGTDANPYYDMMTHEFGHVLDNVGQANARDNVIKVTNAMFKKDNVGVMDLPIDEQMNLYNSWMLKNAPSKYSLQTLGKDPIPEFDLHAFPSNTESLAEAFLDVERNGANAKPMSKLLNDLLIDESKKDYKPKPLLDLVIPDESSAGMVVGDYVPNPVDVHDFIDVPDNHGRWAFRETYREPDLDPNYESHDWEIAPQTYPKVETLTNKYGREGRIYYDPEVTSVHQGEFRIEVDVKPNHITDLDPPESYIYRGMSSEEYELARKRGYFESLGDYNIGDEQKGLTYFSTRPESAANYATGFAPQQFQPTFDHPAYVVGIKRPTGLKIEGGHEIGVPGRIPVEEVKKAYVAKPYAIFPGQTSASTAPWTGPVANGSTAPVTLSNWSETVAPQKIKLFSMEPDIYDSVNANGGITIDIGGIQPTKGYVYAFRKDTEVVIPQKDWTPDHLDKFIDDHIDDLNQPGNNLGVWVQDGNVYMDISKVGKPTAETLAEAQKAKQLAVFDLEEFSDLDIGKLDNKGRYIPNGTPTDLNNQYREQILRRDQIAGRRSASKLLPDSAASTGTRPAVVWDGPVVAKPIDSQTIDDEINSAWRSFFTFDDRKGGMREGARAAQKEGFTGLTEDQLKRMKDGLGVEDQLLGKELVARAVHEKPMKDPLWRGIRVTQEQADALTKSNNRISLPLSSFSKEEDVGRAYAGAAVGSKDAADKSVGLLFKLEPGSKAAYVDDDWVTFGQFKITRILDPKTLDIDSDEVWEIAEDYGIGLSEVAEKAPKMIVLQQESMKEATKQASLLTSGAKDAVIPDISILDTGEDIFERRYIKNTGVMYLDDARGFLAVDKKIKPVGFTPNQQLDVEVVTEAVDALDDMTVKYPQTQVAEFGFKKMEDNTGGYTEVVGWDNKGVMKSRIVINEDLTYDKWKEVGKKATDANWHYVGSDENPIASTVYHEFGHAINNTARSAGYHIKEMDIEDKLFDYWEKYEFPLQESDIDDFVRKSFINSTYKYTPEEIASATPNRISQLINLHYSDWKRANLSGYSMTGNGSTFVDAEEALAEAFDAVERLGNDAPDAAKLLYNMMIENYKEALKEKGLKGGSKLKLATINPRKKWVKP